jgi:pSer/pThr/pTyr-binding forkhead associated (FHA) protein
MRSRVLLGLIFGAGAGFLGYLLQEVSVPHDAVLMPTAADMARLGLFVGAMLGLGLGCIEGAALGSARVLLRGAALGALIGGFAGIFGVIIGGTVYNLALFGKSPVLMQQQGSLLDFTHMVLARALGWTFLGALPGLAVGASTRSTRRALHGLCGGLIGGFLGGFVFDLVATLIAQPVQGAAGMLAGRGSVEIGGPSRAIGFTLIGGMTGLFIGLVDEWLKQAWVRVLSGSGEGRDHILSKPVTVLGRDERADIPLFGDPTLAPEQCAICTEGGRFVLHTGAGGAACLVNGRPVQQQILKDSDMLQLGQIRLAYREKATASKFRQPVDVGGTGPLSGSVAVPSHLCPFCGTPKDASGACQCSVAPAAPGPSVFTEPAPMASPGWSTPGGPPTTGRLQCMEGPLAGSAFPLDRCPVTIGRASDRTVVLAADSTVSRNHATIASTAIGHLVHDDGSANGTFVNGVRITDQALAPGDVIHIGRSMFRYE